MIKSELNQLIENNIHNILYGTTLPTKINQCEYCGTNLTKDNVDKHSHCKNCGSSILTSK